MSKRESDKAEERPGKSRKAEATADGETNADGGRRGAGKVRIIAVYSYKGGVGKTALTVELGTMLARTQRVLLVDGDVQCNLTGYFEERSAVEAADPDDPSAGSPALRLAEPVAERSFEETINELQTGARPVLLNQHELARDAVAHDRILDSTTPSLYHAWQPALDDIRSLRPVDPVQLPGRGGNLFLLRGDTRLVMFEEALATASSRVSGVGFYAKHKPVLGSFRRLMKMQATQIGASVVLVDLGPSSGVLNQVMVTSCDYILTPCGADLNSAVSAHGLLTQVLPMWFKWAKEVRDKEARSEHKTNPAWPELDFHKRDPYLLPLLVTQYRVTNAGQGLRVARGPSDFIKALEHFVSQATQSSPLREQFIPCFDAAGTPVRVAPIIRHQGQLYQRAASHQLAMHEVTRGHAQNAADWAALKVRVREQQDHVAALAQFILQLPFGDS